MNSKLSNTDFGSLERQEGELRWARGLTTRYHGTAACHHNSSSSSASQVHFWTLIRWPATTYLLIVNVLAPTVLIFCFSFLSVLLFNNCVGTDLIYLLTLGDYTTVINLSGGRNLQVRLPTQKLWVRFPGLE